MAERTDDEFTSARDQEREAARRPADVRVVLPEREPLRMLVRRGFEPRLSSPDLPFPEDVGEDTLERFAALLDRYSFRLFLRGAICGANPFRPEETTRYVDAGQARAHAEALVSLGLAVHLDEERFRLVRRPRSFGPVLEWYVARLLRRGLGFEVVTGVRFGARGVGGDLDVVACAEGKLLYLEAKSSPPKHLSAPEVGAFLERVAALRPDVSVFLMDTSLRLADKVLPMFADALGARGLAVAPRRIRNDAWVLGEHLFVVGAKPSLSLNLAAAVAEGFRACGPGLK